MKGIMDVSWTVYILGGKLPIDQYSPNPRRELSWADVGHHASCIVDRITSQNVVSGAENYAGPCGRLGDHP